MEYRKNRMLQKKPPSTPKISHSQSNRMLKISNKIAQNRIKHLQIKLKN